MLLLTWRWADPGLFPALQPVQDVGLGAWITWEWDRGCCTVPDHRKIKDWDTPAVPHHAWKHLWDGGKAREEPELLPERDLFLRALMEVREAAPSSTGISQRGNVSCSSWEQLPEEGHPTMLPDLRE